MKTTPMTIYKVSEEENRKIYGLFGGYVFRRKDEGHHLVKLSKGQEALIKEELEEIELKDGVKEELPWEK